MSVDTEIADENDLTGHDLGPQNEEDIVYNEETEMSTFLPIPEGQQQEIEAVRAQLLQSSQMPWPTVENKPINECNTPFIATMAFPTLFPDGKVAQQIYHLCEKFHLQIESASYKIC